MRKKISIAIAFLTSLSLIASFLTLKKAQSEDTFKFDSWEDDLDEEF